MLLGLGLLFCCWSNYNINIKFDINVARFWAFCFYCWSNCNININFHIDVAKFWAFLFCFWSSCNNFLMSYGLLGILFWCCSNYNNFLGGLVGLVGCWGVFTSNLCYIMYKFFFTKLGFNSQKTTGFSKMKLVCMITKYETRA